ncbi:MAG: hypothetical protein KKF56_05545 [Nanoarchaeota archaeon]|nr:hypothetical protein [Nanoarchaeota archaeon]
MFRWVLKYFQGNRGVVERRIGDIGDYEIVQPVAPRFEPPRVGRLDTVDIPDELRKVDGRESGED